MNIFFDVIVPFIAGLGTFLIGCKLLSDNIEMLANNKIKGLFNKSSKNRLVGVGIGATTTAIGANQVKIVATDLVKDEIPKDIFDNLERAIKKLKDLEFNIRTSCMILKDCLMLIKRFVN